MDVPPPLPPPQTPKKSRLWILFVLLGVFVLMVFAGIAAIGVFAVRKAQEQRAALAEMEKAALVDRAKMADSIRDGNENERAAAVERMKTDLRRAAPHLGNTEAAVARGMAAWTEKLQVQSRELMVNGERMGAAKVCDFDIRDHETIEVQRKLVRDFIASNAKLTDMVVRGRELVGAELDSAGVPAGAREATMVGYAKEADKIRPPMLKIRECDRTIGESALGVLDLLDVNWGKWRRDAATGRLRFDDRSTLDAFNGFIRKIQTAAGDETAAQQTLAVKMKGEDIIPAAPGATAPVSAPSR